MSNVRWLEPTGDTTPDSVLRDALTAARRDAATGAEVGVVVGQVTVAADGTRFYEVTYSSIAGDSLLWLAKKIELAAVEVWEEE